jgi:hypothetical protein
MLCVLSINFVGDGLRDALDPRSWRVRAQPVPQAALIAVLREDAA